MGLGLSFGETGEGPRFRKITVPHSAGDAGGAARHRSRARSRLRDGGGAHHPPGTRRPGAADRLLRQSLDAGDLHGGGRLLQGFPPDPKSLASSISRQVMHALLGKLADAVTAYLNGQVRGRRAGAARFSIPGAAR